jgi:glutamate 5-kinase
VHIRCHPLRRTFRISILTLTDEDNPIDEISRIEEDLEELADVSERCRKIILVSKAAIAGGAASLFFMMLGLFGSNQVAAIGSIAVVLGGIVSLGSNLSTLQQTIAAMTAAEARRSDLINGIDLRVIGDSRP